MDTLAESNTLGSQSQPPNEETELFSPAKFAIDLLKIYGGRALVRALEQANAHLWDHWNSESDWPSVTNERITIAFPNCSNEKQEPESEIAKAYREVLVAHGQKRLDAFDDSRILNLDAFIAWFVPPAVMRDDDRRFYICEALRTRKKETCWTSELRHAFHELSGIVKRIQMEADSAKRRPSDGSELALTFDDLKKRLNDSFVFVPPENEAYRKEFRDDYRDRYLTLYLEGLRFLGFVIAGKTRGSIELSSNAVDAEFVISNLYGVSTSIPGLDRLFGGAGIILPSGSRPSRGQFNSRCVLGRVIIIRGQFGCGKSLLACHIAASVARKGGSAVILSLEQEHTEYYYMLSSSKLLPVYGEFSRHTDTPKESLGKKGSSESPAIPGCGEFRVLSVNREKLSDARQPRASSSEPNQSTSLQDLIRELEQWFVRPLRLLVIDSLGAVPPVQSESGRSRRNILHDTLRDVVSKGVNVILLKEESGNEEAGDDEEYLSDTVVRVSSRRELGYAKRLIEIVKCRFQREQRGEHHFRIVSGKGINVIPSAATARTFVAQQPAYRSQSERELDIELLSNLFRQRPRSGQILVLEGRTGTRKTETANALLACVEPKDLRRRLVVGDAAWNNDAVKSEGCIAFVPPGFTSPGEVFQRLDELTLGESHSAGGVAVIVIDDIAALDVDMPMVSSEPSFGHALVEYLRRKSAVTIVLMRSIDPGEPCAVRRAVLDDADYHVRLTQSPGGQGASALVSAVRSPNMQHRIGWYDVELPGAGDHTKPRLSRYPALVSIESDVVRPLRAIAYVWSDGMHGNRTDNHVENLLHPGLESTLELHVVSQQGVLSPIGLRVESRSIDKCIRVIQMDEFELPADCSGPKLWAFPREDIFNGEHEDVFVDELVDNTRHTDKCRKIQGRPGNEDSPLHNAVPFFCNVPFLVCRGGTPSVVRQLIARRKARQQTDSFYDFSKTWQQLESIPSNDEGRLIQELDWESLAEVSDEFERCRSANELELDWKEFGFSADETDKVRFFQIGGWTDENQNLVFLEILLWLESNEHQYPKPEGAKSRDPKQWFTGALAKEAALLFRKLCRPAHLRDRTCEVSSTKKQLAVPEQAPKAYVSRQWFSSLKPLAQALDEPVQRALTVRTLPSPKGACTGATEDRTTKRTSSAKCTIAGHMYLGVLADSALPEGALQFIHVLTTRTAEYERFRQGMGLPPRKAFYESEERLPITPSVSISASRAELRNVIENSFRRSHIAGYAQAAVALSDALTLILHYEPAGNDVRTKTEDLERYIESIMGGLGSRIAFLEEPVPKP